MGPSANPILPEASVIAWLRNGALMVTQRDTGNAVPPIPKGLRAYFSGSIGHAHVSDLIFNHSADNQSALTACARLHRANPSPLVFPRQIHPAQVVSHAALTASTPPASGAAASSPAPSAPANPLPASRSRAQKRPVSLSAPAQPPLSSPHLLPTLLNARSDPDPKPQALPPL